MRHKEVHGINAHPSMKFVIDFGMNLISEKIRKRVRVYTNLEEMLNCNYIEKDVLPKEYGGTQPMSEMIGIYLLIFYRIFYYDKPCINFCRIVEGRIKTVTSDTNVT